MEGWKLCATHRPVCTLDNFQQCRKPCFAGTAISRCENLLQNPITHYWSNLSFMESYIFLHDRCKDVPSLQYNMSLRGLHLRQKLTAWVTPLLIFTFWCWHIWIALRSCWEQNPLCSLSLTHSHAHARTRIIIKESWIGNWYRSAIRKHSFLQFLTCCMHISCLLPWKRVYPAIATQWTI
jgi:hypothetical protein